LSTWHPDKPLLPEEHEEDVDAEETAGQLGGSFVEADDGENGQRPTPSRPGERVRVFVVSPGSTG
jgi:hypothetical protein